MKWDSFKNETNQLNIKYFSFWYVYICIIIHYTTRSLFCQSTTCWNFQRIYFESHIPVFFDPLWMKCLIPHRHGRRRCRDSREWHEIRFCSICHVDGCWLLVWVYFWTPFYYSIFSIEKCKKKKISKSKMNELEIGNHNHIIQFQYPDSNPFICPFTRFIPISLQYLTIFLSMLNRELGMAIFFLLLILFPFFRHCRVSLVSIQF